MYDRKLLPLILTLTSTLILTLALTLKHKNFLQKRNDVIFQASVQVPSKVIQQHNDDV